MIFKPIKTRAMIWVLIILSFLICLLLYLPFEVEVDSEKDIYRARWKGVFGIRGIPSEKGWHWFYQIFFFQKEWSIREQPSKPTSVKKTRKQKKTLSSRQVWQLFKRSIKAIQVKRLFINWDTDDYITNAYLYPLTYFFGKHKQRFQINFSEKQELSILLQVRPFRLIAAFVAAIFYHKKITS